ncbi:IucA/IucC family protein [Streptomyces sp. ME19-01-6]|uniref:IucA/IucC family protein n=1 Tax=Streptomyces sp. ME19-01-6 TaxID=3028686 RepID=UPI0029A317FC|nr:IucA/IucC family protein [Streptomyces sp. ME19-01-6]MDX3231528.1 IucA/IucC family protein [Streptomyces sp. ME19-01-6]
MSRADEEVADTPDASDAFEAELLARVLDALLREDAYGLRSRARTVRRRDGEWLRVVLTDGAGVLLPVEPDGFQCEIRVRRPARLLVEGEPGGNATARAEGSAVAQLWAEPRGGAAPAPRGGGPVSADAPGGAAPRAAAGPPAWPAPRPATLPAAGPAAGPASGPAAGPDTEPAALPGTHPAFAPPRVAETASYSPPGGAALIPLTTLEAILARLRHAADPDDRGLYDAFVVECRRTLDAMRLHAHIRPRVVERLIAAYGGEPAEQWAGVRGSLAYDTLAAFRDHPVYPTGRARLALSDAEQRAHAPEFHPSFRLRWVALPREVVAGDPARLPAWWPTPGALGLPYGHGLDDSHLAFPVHPLSAPRALAVALRATRLTDRAHLADALWLDVRPTLSMRTVAVTDDPLTHLKLPLATATLGARNRRTIKPGTLADGDAGQRLTEAVLAREPRPDEGVLLADEGTYLHAGHEFLATLVRRYPPGLDGCQVVPLAALLSPAPGDPRTLVADALAARYYGGDLFALLDAYLTLLFDVHTTLFAYGVALETHQQNTSLVLDTEHGRPRLRLLLKDHDGPRVHPARLAGAVGGDEAARLLGGFDDRRITTDGDGPVADVFATITVHLCAGALAFELARLGRAPLDTLLRLIRDRLAEAIDRLGDHRPGAPGAVLRALVLDADRLPVKAMVTAGSLFTKQRSGAADINKHYVTGPNYLLPAHGR